MKKAILILALSFILVSCSEETSYVIEDDYMMFATSYNTTKQEIKYAASKFSNYGVDIIIDKSSEFKDNGKIKVLKMKIAYDDISGNKVRRDTLSFKVKRMGLLFRNYGFKIRYDRIHGATFASVGPVN